MLRAAYVCISIVAVTAALLPLQWIAVKFNLRAKRRIPVLYHRIVCAIIGVRIHVVGEMMHEHPLLIVANHASWLDIPVITAIAPVVFVAKHEIADWPVFGFLAKLQRSVFVDRARRHKTPQVTREIAQRLTEGDPVVLFGEGTSSDGNRVLPFRSALIGAARDALAAAEHVERVWIQPLALAYTSQLGLPLGRQDRPKVAWYGDFALVPHLLGVARRGAIDVTVIWGEPIAFDETSDRKSIARALEATVRRETAFARRASLPKKGRDRPPRPAISHGGCGGQRIPRRYALPLFGLGKNSW